MKEIIAGLLIGAGLAFGGLFLGLGAQSASATYVAWQRDIDPSWNKRGYIRCVNGHLEMGSIDIEGVTGRLNLNEDLCK